MVVAQRVLEIRIDSADADDGELADLTQRLRSELIEFDVDGVDLARAPGAPDGAKAIDPVALGTLIVHLGSLPQMLGAVSEHARDWLRRQHARAVKLTIDGDTLELTNVSSSEQDRLIEVWVARHAAQN